MKHSLLRVEAIDEAREFIKDAIRNEPLIPFHKDSLFSPLSSRLREQLGGAEASSERIKAVFSAAIQEAGAACPGLSVVLRDNLYGIDLAVTGEAEWADALRYAHGGGEEAARKLSLPAAELLERVESGELTEQFRSELSVRHRIRLFGFSSDFATTIEEIRVKKGIEIGIEEGGERYPQKRRLLRFSILSRSDPANPRKGHNPILPENAGRMPTRREFQRWFLAMLADSPFNASEPGLVWSINSRREFLRCFPESAWGTYNRSEPIAALLSTLRSHPVFRTGWDLGHRTGAWTVTVIPSTTWEDTRRALRVELARPTTESIYAMSPQAAVLYDWVNSLPSGSLEVGLTPELKKEIQESRLLLDCPWSAENLRLYLELLCEEISGRTPMDLRVVDWLQSGSVLSRIRVKMPHPT
jgi:hypothetical protein